ncbi:tRNA/rRNA methyltransferase, SpoU [Thioploca ingrica]|uniref:tRNA (cytidine/uridine-2'-O-)-methyltransferase TrmJ n=1 Tax=Thioploca ingrica TaxID=40754 RepID=A0A090AKY8_9GAMM|nr:tRNA/rRNA methyltransferase, SpoU [Thioploca ingrica]
MFDQIKIVLVGITHPGNIGAAARAMKTMGLSQLALVQPKQFPCAEATARATGADDVLAHAQLFDNFTASIQDCHLILGTSARQRSIAWPVLTPRACAEQTLTIPHSKVAIIFGREHSGLTNQELDQCHAMVQIPTSQSFGSLNVAAAVQIIAYELRMKSEELQVTPEGNLKKNSLVIPASAAAMTQFYQHLEQTLIDIGFLDPLKPRRLMRRLHRLFNRTQLIDSEVNILRGILTAAQEQCRRHKP